MFARASVREAADAKRPPGGDLTLWAIEGWWVRCPSANVLVASDNESGPMVLGVDLDAGGSGSLAALEREGGPRNPQGTCLA